MGSSLTSRPGRPSPAFLGRAGRSHVRQDHNVVQFAKLVGTHGWWTNTWSHAGVPASPHFSYFDLKNDVSEQW